MVAVLYLTTRTERRADDISSKEIIDKMKLCLNLVRKILRLNLEFSKKKKYEGRLFVYSLNLLIDATPLPPTTTTICHQI